MARQKALLAVMLAGLLVIGGIGQVSAHSWQTQVTQGEMELGISSSPETPVAGMQTEFSARIKDAQFEGDANRTDWGGVTNNEVEVHIRGPDGYHDHVKTEIPEDGAHFHFTYMFPTNGNYSISVVTSMEGQEYAFEFQKQVMLLPAKATGEEIHHMSEEVHSVQKDVKTVNDNVEQLDKDVQDTNKKVKQLQTQVETLQTELEEQNQPEQKSSGLGFGAGVFAVGAAVGAGAVVIGKRS